MSKRLKDRPTKPLIRRGEFPKGRDAEQMKITWPATRKIEGIFKMHGRISLNDRDEYSETG